MAPLWRSLAVATLDALSGTSHTLRPCHATGGRYGHRSLERTDCIAPIARGKRHSCMITGVPF